MFSCVRLSGAFTKGLIKREAAVQHLLGAWYCICDLMVIWEEDFNHICTCNLAHAEFQSRRQLTTVAWLCRVGHGVTECIPVCNRHSWDCSLQASRMQRWGWRQVNGKILKQHTCTVSGQVVCYYEDQAAGWYGVGGWGGGGLMIGRGSCSCGLCQHAAPVEQNCLWPPPTVSPLRRRAGRDPERRLLVCMQWVCDNYKPFWLRKKTCWFF